MQHTWCKIGKLQQTMFKFKCFGYFVSHSFSHTNQLTIISITMNVQKGKQSSVSKYVQNPRAVEKRWRTEWNSLNYAKKNILFLKILKHFPQICKCCHYAYDNTNTEEYTGVSYWSQSPAHWCRSPEWGVCCVLGRWWRGKTGCWCLIRHSAGFRWPVQRWQRNSRRGRRVETDALASAACSALQLYQLQQQHKQRQQQFFQVFLEHIDTPLVIPKESEGQTDIFPRNKWVLVGF